MPKYLALVALIVCIFVVCARAQTPPSSTPDPRAAFANSLALRTERLITDSSYPAIIWLSQAAPVSYPSSGTLKLKLSLAPETAGAKPVKELGISEIFQRDLLVKPFAASANLSGVADGPYRIIAELFEDDQSLIMLEKPIVLAAGIDTRLPEIERRLAKIQGHESTKATIRYPFDAAMVLNIGQRGWNAADLGINQASEPNYFNFSEGISRSEELLTALEAGKDPLWQAKGNTKRHYFFAPSGEILPYHVYVPPSWDGKTPLPMVFMLHGNTRNQDFYFERDGQIIPKQAEKHGFMLVGVFGFHPNGGYNVGALRHLSAPAAASQPALGARRGARGATPAGTNTPVFMNGMSNDHLGELSEADTIQVYDLVKAEYPIDPKRTFLFGYSAGGNGGFYIAPKYAQNWVAAAFGGASIGPANYPFFDRYKNPSLPLFVFAGENDSPAVRTNSLAMVDAMKRQQIDAQFKIYPGATHDTAPSAAVADIFDFFAAHERK